MKIALHGYGKMGHAVEAVAAERGHEIVARFDINEPPKAEGLGDPDVIIDFSNASAIDRLVDVACGAKAALVIGTTGWNEKLVDVRSRCEKADISVVYAANFSPGANAMFALAKRAGEILAQVPGYEAGLEERHHSQKKDAPSGTALRIAAAVREGSAGAFDPPIVASRVGQEFGLHTLFFDSSDDIVEISHRARGRRGFARGAVLAAEALIGKKGFFSFDELITIF